MYKAIEKIGGYKIGEEVPADKAETWLKMYKFAPVEKVDEESENSSEDKSDLDETSGEQSSDPMLDDYLSRNANVVKKNVEEDDLSQEKLEELFELEKSNKNREQVVEAIEKKLKELGA